MPPPIITNVGGGSGVLFGHFELYVLNLRSPPATCLVRGVPCWPLRWFLFLLWETLGSVLGLGRECWFVLDLDWQPFAGYCDGMVAFYDMFYHLYLVDHLYLVGFLPVPFLLKDAFLSFSFLLPPYIPCLWILLCSSSTLSSFRIFLVIFYCFGNILLFPLFLACVCLSDSVFCGSFAMCHSRVECDGGCLTGLRI